MAGFVPEHMNPSSSIHTSNCVHYSTDHLEGYVIMLAHFAFLDKGTHCKTLAKLSTSVSLCIKGKKPIGVKACDMQCMLLNFQTLVCVDPSNK